jgi:hypothetical protein
MPHTHAGHFQSSAIAAVLSASTTFGAFLAEESVALASQCVNLVEPENIVIERLKRTPMLKIRPKIAIIDRELRIEV